MDWTQGGVGSGTVKLAWDEVPAFVRAGVEDVLGDEVVRTVSHPGGFTPGLASRVDLAGGGEAFVKSVGDDVSSEAAAMHRAEARILDGLRGHDRVPEMIAALDERGWVTLVLGYVDGRHPATPWRADDLALVLRGLDALAADLTPAPVDAPRIAEKLGRSLSGWRALADDPGAIADAWVLDHLVDLAHLEARWEVAATGETLLHADLRADQMLIRPDGLTVLDWAHACIGAAWFDIVFMAPSVALQGGPAPDDLLGQAGIIEAVDDHALTCVVAAVAGFFVHRGTLPPIPKLPTVRDFQRAQGQVALEWLRGRLA